MLGKVLGNFCTWIGGAYRGMNALMISAFKNDFEGVAECLHRGYGINQKDKFGGTALMCVAAKDNCASMVKYLLDNGADPNLLDDKGRSALLFAVAYGRDVDAIKLLIAHGADIKIKDENNNTLLHLEVLSNNSDFEIIKMLLKGGVDVKALNNSGDNAYIISISKNVSPEITLILLRAAYPESNIDIIREGDDIFIVSAKDKRLDGYLVRYRSMMDMFINIQGYIYYEDSKRLFARAYIYEKGEIANSLMGAYHEGKLICIGTSKDNMQPITESTYFIGKKILDDITTIADFSNGDLQEVNIENIIEKIANEA